MKAAARVRRGEHGGLREPARRASPTRTSRAGVGARLGLQRLQANPFADEDGITSLETAPEKSARGYIPYSNRRLLWHTDGYYNPPQQRIRAFILHCVRPAAAGGENRLLDQEIAYILLRDADPRIRARALRRPTR